MDRDLTPNTALQLVWGTNTATWSVDPEPNTVDYLGSIYSPISAASLLNNSNSMYVNLATVTTDASGNFSLKTAAPTDFGGNHDIWAVAGGVGVANGSFDQLRTVTISPKSGPVGTPITVTYTSMDANAYGGGGSVLWDNHYAGEIMGNWTRGTASVTIRAAGAVGTPLRPGRRRHQLPVHEPHPVADHRRQRRRRAPSRSRRAALCRSLRSRGRRTSRRT